MSDDLAKNLKGLIDLLNQSKDAYIEYHSNNGQYKYAKKLRVINDKVSKHIEKIEASKDLELKEAIIELEEHLEQWSLLWEKKSKSNNFQDKDKFVFTGYKSYPRTLDKLLISRLK